MPAPDKEIPLVFSHKVRDWLYVGRLGLGVVFIVFGVVQMSLHHGFQQVFLPFLGIAFLLAVFSLRGIYEERIEISGGAVRFTRRGLLRWKKREEKLSDFIGVEALMKQPSGSRGGQDYFAKYIIVMVHKDRSRSFILSDYTQHGQDLLKEFSGMVKGDYIKEMRFMQEQYARALGLPVMTIDPDSGNYTLRKVENLDKSISELRKAGKTFTPGKIKKYEGSKLKVSSENGELKVVYDPRLQVLLVVLGIWSLAVFILIYAPAPYHPFSAVIGFMGLLVFVFANFSQELELTATEARFTQKSLFPFFRVRSAISLDKIEEVRMGRDPLFSGAPVVCIVSDEVMINFGRGVGRDDREWVREAVLGYIK